MRRPTLFATAALCSLAAPAAAQDPMELLRELLNPEQTAPAADDPAPDAPSLPLAGGDSAPVLAEDKPEESNTQPAAGGMVTAGDPGSVLAALQGYGFAATLETDDEGDPVIRTKMGGVNSSVYFYGCDDNGQDCRSISFAAGFDLGSPFSVDLANQWNADKRFSKSYVSSTGGARLEMDVNLFGGGMTADNFNDTIEWWDYSLNEYKVFIDW